MAQKVFTKNIGASGIVGTLVILGIVLNLLGVAPELGIIAIAAGVCIGILYGLLGAFGIAMSILRDFT